MAKKKVRGRIKYYKEYNFGTPEHPNFKEAYAFEIENEDGKFGLDTAFPLVDDMVHYQALTMIRHWKEDLNIDFWFE